MAKPETAIFTNMCMVTDGRGNVLVQDRNDPGWPGMVFPGGHVEPYESFSESVIREVWEESGIRIEEPRLCGVKQFYTENGCRYVVMLYRADKFTGELRSSDEGEVMWVPRSELFEHKLVNNFEDMLAVFEDDEKSECFYPHGGSEVKFF